MMLHAIVLAAAATCSVPNRDGKVVTQVSPVYPAGVHTKPVSVLVEVVIGADGHVVDATVAQSSNIPQIDTAALRAARASTYAPAIVDCQPTQKSYVFDFDFADPQAGPPAPHFDLPPGWPDKPEATHDATRSISIWRNGVETIIVSVRPTNDSLNSVVDGDLASLNQSGWMPTHDQDVTGCGGKPAKLVNLQSIAGAMNRIAYGELYVMVVNGTEYSALYTARIYAPPSDEISRSLQSLCPQ